MNKAEIERRESDKAFQLFEALLGAKKEVGCRFLLIGSILTEINEEKLYRYYNCDSFQEFLAMPELGFAWQTARLFMHVFDIYIRRLKLNAERIAVIDISKLQAIAPVVEKDPEGWLSIAETTSRSDCINAVREVQGKPQMKMLPAKGGEDEKGLEGFTGYPAFVTAHVCCACGSAGVDAHHFPRTKGAGAADYKVIPLCRKCHSEFHQAPRKFIIANEEKIFNYFYDIILQAYKIITKG